MASSNPLRFHSNAGLDDTLGAVRASLKTGGKIRGGSLQELHKLYLDSFDWRLGHAGYQLEACDSGEGRQLVWSPRDDDTRRLVIRVSEWPRSASDLDPGPLRERLSRLLEARVLMHAAHIRSRQYALEVTNKQGKIVLRIEIAEHFAHDGTGSQGTSLGTWITLLPLRGYAKIQQRSAARISRLAGIAPQSEDLLYAAAGACGIRPLDYSSRLSVKLRAKDPAWKSLAVILDALLRGLRHNEQGMCDAIDIEFLHDFRVFVRRTRAAISDIRGVVDKSTLARWHHELRWLQQLTGNSRDLDVYLLGIPDYRKALPSQHRAGLDAFVTYLTRERSRAHLELTRGIRSQRYTFFCSEFAAFVASLKNPALAGPAHDLRTGDLSADLLQRAYQRVLDDGRQIDADSPAEALHDLRKRCKRLRYLLEFFASLHPGDDLTRFVRALKGLQENLGNFQDYEVQADTLQRMSLEMMEEQLAPPETYLALGVLIERLHDRCRQAREEFADRFARFDTKATRKRFARICGPAS